MIADVKQIAALHWQPRLDKYGEVVEGIDDITQCIRIILTTPKRSDPHRPEFGCDAWQQIDLPVPEAVPHLVRTALEAIARWEPRAEVVNVTPVFDTAGDGATVTLRVEWRLAIEGAAGDVQVTEVLLR